MTAHTSESTVQRLEMDLEKEPAMTQTTATPEIEKLRTQVAGREKHIEQLHAEIGRLRIHVEGLQNTAEGYLAEKQQLGEWLAKAEAERCANCDHQARFHSEGGCWFTVTTGQPDGNLVCPCTVKALQP